MSNFEENIGWILTDFGEEKINHAEAIIKIERLVADCLGFHMLNHDICNKVAADITRRHKRQKKVEPGESDTTG